MQVPGGTDPVKKFLLQFLTLCLFAWSYSAYAADVKGEAEMSRKVLFVVTSHGDLGDTGKPTGYFLSEVTHPWSEASKEFEIDVVSPKGGKPPVTGFDLNDPINKRYWEDKARQEKMDYTLTPAQVNPDDYAAIYYAGGHGAMWDLPDNKEIAAIAEKIYKNGGVVAAVCHGPAGFVNVKREDGKYLVDGKKFDCFTNEEETLNGTQNIVPFMPQSKLQEHGGIFDGAKPWSDHVAVDGRLVTGQNPQSALTLGKKLVETIKKRQ